MQEHFQTISEFIRRTDDLAHRKGLNLSEIHGILGISKAMVFAYRSGKNPISSKVWRKLDDAERAAGIGSKNAERSTSVPQSGIGETAHAELGILRDEVAAYGKKTDAPLTLEQRVEKVEAALDVILTALQDMKSKP